MKKEHVFLCFLLFSILPFASSNLILGKQAYKTVVQGDSTLVSGYISENTTWTLEGSPYIVVSDVIVEPEVFLDIRPGVVVRFYNGISLIIEGGIIAVGNNTHKIRFTSNGTTSSGDWGTIDVREHSTAENQFEHVQIEYASVALRISANCSIIHSSLESNNKGILLENSQKVQIEESRITNNTGLGIGGTADRKIRIEHSNISSNGAGVSISGSLFMRNCTVMNNGGTGISGHELIAKNCTISNNVNGISVGCDWIDSSAIVDCVITGNSANGVHLPNCGETQINVSKISDNGGSGIYCASEGNTIKVHDSDISRNNNGIRLTMFCNAHVYGSTIENNNIGGVVFSDRESSLTLDNSVIQNNQYGIYTTHTIYGANVEASDSVVANNSIGIKASILDASSTIIANNSDVNIHVYTYSDWIGGICILENAVVCNSLLGIQMDSGTIEYSDIHNHGIGIRTESGNIKYSNIFNHTEYGIVNEADSDVNATHNWWGTANESIIETLIFDFYDDFNLGRVLHEPYLMAPVESYPVASFLYEPSSPVLNERVTFDASASYDSDGSIASYSWDFGDDTNATETEPITNHAYTAAGTYTITLNVTDNDGLTDISKESISIGKVNSTISILASPKTLIVGENTTINGTVTPTRGGAKVIIWYKQLGEYTWGNLTVIVTDENSTYSYAWTPSEPGTYELKANWLGDENTCGAESSTITVTRLSPPVPSFTYSPTTPLVGAEITFNASSSYDVDEDIASFRWDFDDGNISSTVSPIIVYTYMFPRTYNVTLTVEDLAGLNSSYFQNVSVKMPTSVSVLTSSPSTLVGFRVNITGTLHDIHGNGLGNETVVLQYTFSGVGTWTPITSDATDNFGNYQAIWIPPATGDFVIKAEWAGNTTHLGANSTTALSSLAYQNQYVFSIESNSTISELAFNTTDWTLSFTASGRNGTRGYIKVTVAKSLVTDITNIRVYLDGNQTTYSITTLDDSWLLTFNYVHSTHQVAVDLDINIIPEFASFLILPLLMIATLLAVIICKRKRQSE